MSRLSTALQLYKEDRSEFLAALVKNCAFLFSDKAYLSRMFKLKMGYKIDWMNPKSYSEKLQWLKLNDRNPLYTKLVDKFEVKQYVKDKIGSEHIIKTLGVWDKPENINFNDLPDRFVLKTTHGGGNTGIVICKNKQKLDVEKTIICLKDAMNQNLYRDSREWPYKNVKKRIVAEELLEDIKTGELRDYKFFCFDGKIKALFVATERQKRKEPFFNFFDENYNSLDIQQGHPKADIPPAKPLKFDEMVSIASKLSRGLLHVRVDLYEANDKVYFGELTFYHFGGMVPFNPAKWDNIFGSWLDLNKLK